MEILDNSRSGEHAAAERQAQLDGLVDFERALREDLEQKLAHASTALHDAEQRHLAAMAAAAEQLAERDIKYELAIARSEASWGMVDEQLRAAALEVERARQIQTSASADVERLSRRESELSALLADATATRSTLEQRLADATAALEAANARAAEERRAASEQLASRQREFQAQLAEEVEKRHTVEDTLAQAVSARDDAETQHRAAMTDAAAQVRALEGALGEARHDLESRAADVERLTGREAELSSMLADIRTSHAGLERRLAATEDAFQDADARATRERLAASKRFAEREAELDRQIWQERATREALERTVADAETAMRDAQQRHEAALATAANGLAERKAHFNRELSQAAADRDRLTQRLSEAESALEQVRHDHQSASSEVARLTQREADLTSQLADVQTAGQTLERELADGKSAISNAAEREAELVAQIQQERAGRAVLEQAIADGETALRDALQRHEAALATASNEFAAREARFNRELSQAATDRDCLAQRLSEAESALEQVRHDHQSATTDLAHLRQREADLTSQLAEVQAARHTLEHELADAKSAISNAAEREAELVAQIQLERAGGAALEQAVADGEAALRDALQRHEAALATSSNEFAERQAHFDRELSQTAADRDRLTQRLNETEAALDQVRRDHQSATSEVARLTQREADLVSELAGVETARHTLEGKLAEAVRAAGGADERAARERAAAANRQADLEARLAQAVAAGEILEQTLTETRSAASAAERLFHEKAEALRAHGLEQGARFEVQLARERLEHESRLMEMGERLRNLELERESLQQSLTATQEQSLRLDGEHREARERLEQALTAADAEIRRLAAALSEAERTVADGLHEFQSTLDRLSDEHGTALAALAATVAERDAQLQEREARYEHLQETSTATLHELEVTKRSVEALRTEADQAQRLHQELAESRAESHRLFQQAGLAMFRCSRDGALTEANRACMTLVGRRTMDELSGVDFAAAVFENPNGLSWLIERCMSAGKESIETGWRRKDGGRLLVRLSAHALSSDVFEIAAEDLTRLRVLQERLGRAHRMEAVGRLASEVAVTCGRLLGDAHRNVREWLMTAGSHDASRQQYEILLDEVTRAAGLLQQLCVYGEEQASTPELVDLNTVIHDLGPILKRVTGHDVEIQLPDASPPLYVDTAIERIERLLVNLAGYGRERMPFGGLMKIELGTTTVDGRFAAEHPNVRPGLHALITVTESRRAARANRMRQLRDGTPADSTPGRAGQKPGVDFGVLQELVGECGGHLWMTIQPLGDMVAKIRLPLIASYDQTAPATLVARGGRERTLMRRLQH